MSGNLPRMNAALKATSGSHLVASSASGFFNLDDNSRNALFYCSLLALQFGLQPMIASKFTPSGVSRSSVVIATELAKIVIAAITIFGGPSVELEKIKESWSVGNSLRIAALPATLYAIQNLFVQYGYVLLDSMTFNLLNQTKVDDFAFDWSHLSHANFAIHCLCRHSLQLCGYILLWASHSHLYKWWHYLCSLLPVSIQIKMPTQACTVTMAYLFSA